MIEFLRLQLRAGQPNLDWAVRHRQLAIASPILRGSFPACGLPNELAQVPARALLGE